MQPSKKTAFISSGFFSTICDIGFTALVPMHAYFILEDVIRDYSQLSPSMRRNVAMLVSGLIGLGFAYLTFNYGVTQSIKYLWKTD